MKGTIIAICHIRIVLSQKARKLLIKIELKVISPSLGLFFIDDNF